MVLYNGHVIQKKYFVIDNKSNVILYKLTIHL